MCKNLFIFDNIIDQIRHYIISMWKSIKREIDHDLERYSNTKYGKVVAFGIYCLIFTLMPEAMKIIVPLLSQHMEMKFVYIAISIGTAVAVAFVFNTVMYFVYTLKVPFLEKYRCNPDKPWPWEENSEKWRHVFWRSIKLTAFSLFIVLPLMLWADVSLDFKVNMDVFSPPTITQMMPFFLVFQVMEDIMFFISHRLLHFPFLYKYHKIHHQYTTSVSIAGLHSHFVEFLLSNALSAGIYVKMAQIMLGPIHINVTAIWILLRMWDAYNGHCGYMFSWAPLQLLPLCASDDYHDFHHSQNCGNYGGQFRVLDSLFGYNKDFWEHLQKRKALKSGKST